MAVLKIEEILAEAATLTAQREPYALATVVWRRAPSSAKPGAKALITKDGGLRGWVGGGCTEPIVIREALRSLEDGQPRLLYLAPPDELPAAREGYVLAPITCASEGALEVFVEPHPPRPHLVAIGGAPVVETLANMADQLGFDVAKLDPPQPGDVAGQLEKAGVDAKSFIVVATIGHYDEEALTAALATDAEYIALVGSRKRAASVVDALRSSGLSEEQLKRIRAPAGLDLGPIPHEEIAVAILAEIVQVKAASAKGGPEAVAEREEAIDLVCNMTVDVATAKYTAERDGKTYYFCCDGCRRRFESEPDRYVASSA